MAAGTLKESHAFLLVMTATIHPAATAGVRRADPNARLEDYKDALRFWLRLAHPVAANILLLENSGADLTEFHTISRVENPLGKRVEILSIPGNVIPEGRNYGYTELKMLDDGLAQSRLRQQTTHMVKVTGRLTFPAVGRALDMAVRRNGGQAPELMIDCRKLGFPRRGHDCAVQLWVCSHSFYDRVLCDSREEMNSTNLRLLEQLVYHKVVAEKGKPGVFLRFPCNVDPVGYSGFKGRSYQGQGAAVVSAVRAILRVIAPWYWF